MAQDATEVAADLGIATVLDISKAPTGTGTVTLECFAYSDQAPLGTAEVEVFLFGPDTADYDVPVSVSPRTVPLGGLLSVTATCEPGTEMAVVYLESEGPGAPQPGGGFIFRQLTVTPRAGGEVAVRLRITADHAQGFSDPQVGPARALVLCGDPDAQQPVREGLGDAPFTITAAAAPRPSPAPAAGPELAHTGSDPVRLGGLGVLLLATGLAGGRLGRRRPSGPCR